VTHFENLTRAFNDDFLYVSVALLHFCCIDGWFRRPWVCRLRSLQSLEGPDTKLGDYPLGSKLNISKLPLNGRMLHDLQTLPRLYTGRQPLLSQVRNKTMDSSPCKSTMALDRRDLSRCGDLVARGRQGAQGSTSGPDSQSQSSG